MKIIFVDSENVGYAVLNEIEAEATLSDSVFVFDRRPSARQLCQRNFFHHFSEYSVGKNQADFMLIATLSRVLSQWNKEGRKTVSFELHSYDQALQDAFLAQCRMFGCIKVVIHGSSQQGKEPEPIQKPAEPAPPKKVPPGPKQQPSDKTIKLEQRVLNAMREPVTLTPAFWKQFGLNQTEGNKLFGEMRQNGKVAKKNGSGWVSVGK